MILASGVHGTRGAKWNTESKTKPSEKNVNRNYAKHLGIITVGVSKAHILKLLRDPTIRMVIPYHKSGLNAQVAAALKIAFYEDFTDVQNTMLLKKDGSTVGLSKDGAKIGDKNISDFNFYKYFGKEIDGVFYDGKATAAKYLEWCEKGEYNEDIGEYGYYLTDGSFITKAELDAKGLSVLPKFGEFAAEENYYKLIEDFDCYDTITGEHSSQEAVDFFHDGLPADYKNVLVTALKAEQKVSDDFRDHLDNHGLRDEVMDIVKARGYTPSIKKQAKKKNAENFVEDKYFRTQMQKWDSLTHGAYVKVGEIKEEHPLVKVGMPQGIIRYDVDKLNKNMEKHKYLNTDLLNEIPNIIANPIAISEYTEENTVSVFGDVFVGNSPMMVGVTISKDRSGANISKVRTFNARRDVGTLITNETVLYLNEDKKRTLNWFQACGIQVPLGETKFGFIRSISHKDKTVKKQLKKDSSSYAPTFYSQMGKVVEGIKMDKIGAASVVNFLKGKGIKHDEIKWSGIETFLEGKKSVTKAELQEFIEGSQLQIEENVRDDRWNGVKVKRVSKNVAEAYVDGELLSTFTKIEGGWWQSDKDSYLSAGSFHDIKRAATILLEIDTKWSEYTLDGGKNYREITFKLPNSNYSNGAMQGHWGDNAKTCQ